MPASAIPRDTVPASARDIARMAGEPAVAAILASFAAERRWILDRQVELCRIPAPTFQEQARADWMTRQFRALGCDARLDRAGNVVAWVDPKHEGPVVAITAHLDTVLEPRGSEDIRIGRDGELLGPGVSDNGAGLAALLALAKAFQATQARPLPFALIANVGEEGEGNLSGMRYLCRAGGIASRIACFLVLDGPSVDHLTTRALASRRFEVTFTGPGGHSWSDYGTANPVHALGRLISNFSDLPLIATPDASTRSSYNFGVIEGGTGVNTIPATASAKVDLRSESQSRLEEMSALLTGAVERVLEIENARATGARLVAKVREIGSRPGGQLAAGARLLEHLRAVDTHLGVRSRTDCASTDANVPLSLNLEAVSIGTGGQGGGAHTRNEWFHPEGRERGLSRIALAVIARAREFEPATARAGS